MIFLYSSVPKKGCKRAYTCLHRLSIYMERRGSGSGFSIFSGPLFAGAVFGLDYAGFSGTLLAGAGLGFGCATTFSGTLFAGAGLGFGFG